MNRQFRKWGEKSAPCKNCPDRYVRHENGEIQRCHTKCTRYKEFKDAAENERKARTEFLRQTDAIVEVHLLGKKNKSRGGKRA